MLQSLVAIIFFSSLHCAWGAFPHRPLKILVYTKPGGAIDVFARRFETVARKYTDTKILIINKPGAGGLIALKKLAYGRPDGHMIGAITKSNIGKMVASNGDLNPSQFYWMAMMASDPQAIIVSTNGPFHNWKELVEDAQIKKGQQLWVGPDLGGNDHIMAMKVWDKANISGKWIPYNGGSNAIAALMGGHASVYVGNPGDVLGRPELKIVAIGAHERIDQQFKDVPTFKELGVIGLEDEIMWRGFVAPLKIQKQALDFWMNLFEKVSKDSEWIDFLKQRSMKNEFITSKAFMEYILKDEQDFKQALKSLKMLP